MSSKNQKYEIIKPYLKDKKVLDIGVVQHKIENINRGGVAPQIDMPGE